MDDISTADEHYYIDSTHYLPTAGDMTLSHLFHNQDKNMPIDFGRILTTDNIEEHLLMIRTEQKKYRANYPDEVMEVEYMAEQYNFDAKDIILRMDGRYSKARWFRPESRESPVSKALRDYERGGAARETLYRTRY